jgi:hypothetical protein
MPPQASMPQQSNDRQPVYDGQTDFSGGMDMSRSSELIAQNQSALGINVTFRNGYPVTRSAINQIVLDFAGDTEAEAWFNTHYFQGAAYYSISGIFPLIIASVGGRIFQLAPQALNFEVTDITPLKADGVTLDRNSSILTKAYFCIADVYLIIQDGQSLPFIFDGSTIRRSNPTVPEVPVGTIMSYGQGRLTVGQGNQFLVGDIIGGATNVISFTETTFLTGGGAFILPMDMGVITGMIFTAQQDTNTGQGTLLVFGQTGVISVNLSLPRAQWQSSGIVTVTLTDIGTLADRTLVTINADVFFRSQDGIRTYRDARAEFGQYSLGNYGRTALSYEIGDYLAADTLSLQTYASGIVFDNRYLLTTQPQAVNGVGPPVFQALAVMDFIPVSALRYNQAPVFDGLWTGYQWYQLLEGQFSSGIRAFGFAQGADNAGNPLLQLYEITTTLGLDSGLCPPSCAVETKAFIFGSSLSFKKMQYLRYWADQLQGRVDWTLRIRPDQYPGWILWQTWTDQAPVETCTNTGCSLPNLQPQYRPGRNLTLAPEQCISNGAALAAARTAFAFQIRWEWVGVARMTKMLLTATPMDIPKFDCLTLAPPDDPIQNIIASGSIPPANQFFNTAQTYTCPAGYSGTPVTIPAGTYESSVSVAAANAAALAAAQAAAVCTIDIPVVTSPTTATVAVNGAFSYQITATNSPTSYSATGLPGWASLNASTGLITGTAPSSPETDTITLHATNAGGTGNGTLTLKVKNYLGVVFGVVGAAAPATNTIALDGEAPITIVAGTTYNFTTSLRVTHQGTISTLHQTQGMSIVSTAVGNITVSSDSVVTSSATGTSAAATQQTSFNTTRGDVSVNTSGSTPLSGQTNGSINWGISNTVSLNGSSFSQLTGGSSISFQHTISIDLI